MEGKNSVFNIKMLLSYSPLQKPIPIFCEDLSPPSLYSVGCWVGCSKWSHLDKTPELGHHGGRWWNFDMLANLLMSYTGLHKAIFMLPYKWKLVSLFKLWTSGERREGMEILDCRRTFFIVSIILHTEKELALTGALSSTSPSHSWRPLSQAWTQEIWVACAMLESLCLPTWLSWLLLWDIYVETK